MLDASGIILELALSCMTFRQSRCFLLNICGKTSELSGGCLFEMAVESSSWKEKMVTSPAMDMGVNNDSTRNSLQECFCQTKLTYTEFISGQ